MIRTFSIANMWLNSEYPQHIGPSKLIQEMKLTQEITRIKPSSLALVKSTSRL